MTTTTVSPSISVQQMKETARNMRIDIIKMIGAAGSGHPGGSLSEVELMVALYFKVMRHDPKNPKWDGRDRFILSKGHGCATLYSVLAETRYIDHALLPTFRKGAKHAATHPPGKICRSQRPEKRPWRHDDNGVGAVARGQWIIGNCQSRMPLRRRSHHRIERSQPAARERLDQRDGRRVLN